MENKSSGVNFFSSLKSNLIYICMFVMLICAILFTSNGGSEGLEGSEEIKSKFPIHLILLAVGVLAVFIVLMIPSSKQFQTDARQARPAQKFFTDKVSPQDYEKEKIEATERELKKLYESNKFKSMVNQKGTDSANWTWQTKEKEKKVVFRENIVEDDEDSDHLSQITLSDD